MRKIEIEVNDADYPMLRSLLENLRYIKSVREIAPVDEVSLLSEASLAEDWDSEEDGRYDEIYHAKPAKN